jgi:hypothetical protein
VEPGCHATVGDRASDECRDNDHAGGEAEQPPASVDRVPDQLHDHAEREQREPDREPRGCPLRLTSRGVRRTDVLAPRLERAVDQPDLAGGEKCCSRNLDGKADDEDGVDARIVSCGSRTMWPRT